jgi:hypothetical protein
MRRLEAWLAAVTLRPAGVLAALALFALAGFVVLVEVKYFQDLFKDNAGRSPGGASSSAATAATRC